MSRKHQKKIFVFYIIAFDFFAENSNYNKKGPCQRTVFNKQRAFINELCQQAVLRFHTSLTERFSDSIYPRMMKNMKKVVSCRFKQCLGRFSILNVKRCSEVGLFKHLSNHIFRTPYYRKYISRKGHLFFFQNIENLTWIPEMQQKIQNKIFVCYIIAFEFVAANPHYYKEIFVIESQWVQKQS